jgi:putative sigma-54 modulation protein
MSNHEVILSGVHLDLTEAIKQTVHEKAEKLFKHEERIIRLRVELEYNQNKTHEDEFLAKGHIEINGPALVVTESGTDLYKSIDQMIEKLDRKLRRRARKYRVKRKQTHDVELPASIPKANAGVA